MGSVLFCKKRANHYIFIHSFFLVNLANYLRLRMTLNTRMEAIICKLADFVDNHNCVAFFRQG